MYKVVLDTDIGDDIDDAFALGLLLKNPNIGFCIGGKYYYRKRDDKSSLIDNSSLKKEYFNENDDFNYVVGELTHIFGECLGIGSYDEKDNFFEFVLRKSLGLINNSRLF